MTQSPLAEADPQSLDELFNADPLELTEANLDTLAAEFRSKRKLWEKEEAAAQAQGRRRRPREYKDKVAKGQLSLTDIGLGKK